MEELVIEIEEGYLDLENLEGTIVNEEEEELRQQVHTPDRNLPDSIVTMQIGEFLYTEREDDMDTLEELDHMFQQGLVHLQTAFSTLSYADARISQSIILNFQLFPMYDLLRKLHADVEPFLQSIQHEYSSFHDMYGAFLEYQDDVEREYIHLPFISNREGEIIHTVLKQWTETTNPIREEMLQKILNKKLRMNAPLLKKMWNTLLSTHSANVLNDPRTNYARLGHVLYGIHGQEEITKYKYELQAIGSFLNTYRRRQFEDGTFKWNTRRTLILKITGSIIAMDVIAAIVYMFIIGAIIRRKEFREEDIIALSSMAGVFVLSCCVNCWTPLEQTEEGVILIDPRKTYRNKLTPSDKRRERNRLRAVVRSHVRSIRSYQPRIAQEYLYNLNVLLRETKALDYQKYVILPHYYKMQQSPPREDDLSPTDLSPTIEELLKQPLLPSIPEDEEYDFTGGGMIGGGAILEGGGMIGGGAIAMPEGDDVMVGEYFRDDRSAFYPSDEERDIYDLLYGSDEDES